MQLRLDRNATPRPLHPGAGAESAAWPGDHRRPRRHLRRAGLAAIVALGLGAAAASWPINLVLLRRRFAPLEKLIEDMERVDLSRPGSSLPARSTAVGETEEVERIESRLPAHDAAARGGAAARGRSGALRAQEEERARVARDLHDEVNQSLTGAAAAPRGGRARRRRPSSRPSWRRPRCSPTRRCESCSPRPPAAPDRARRPRPRRRARRPGGAVAQ